MACGSDGAREILQSGESAVHGVPSAPVDTVHTGVGRIAGCTAEWIGGSYAILAAHCVAETAQGCDRPRVALGLSPSCAQYLNACRTPTFALTPSGIGTFGDSVAYDIDGLVIKPNAYGPTLSQCDANQVNSCSSGTETSNYNLNPGHDLALVHFRVGSGQPSPSTIAAPIRVLTSMTANASGTYTLQRSIDPSVRFGIGSNVVATICGWGRNDDPSSQTYRLSGTNTFLLGPSWNVVGRSEQFCNGAPAVGHTEVGVPVQRWQNPDGTYFGASTAVGDSGSGLLVVGGSGPGQFPEISVGETAMMGVLSTGDQTLDGQTLGATNPGLAQYAPTFTPENGSWIEARLLDFDADGVSDSSDNCPFAANPDQADSNRDAEDALGLPRIGDACDEDAATAGEQSPARSFSNGETGPCDTWTISYGTTAHVSFSSGGTCPRRLTSVVDLNSWIGFSYGDAPPATGASQPSYCDCPFANDPSPGIRAQCFSSNFQCTAANDAGFPYLPSPTPSNWRRIRRYENGATAEYTPVAILHQDSSAWAQGFDDFNANALVRTFWNFRADFPSATNLTGLVWTHVTSFTQVNGYGLQRQPYANHPNAYSGVSVALQNGTNTQVIPLNKNLWHKWWLNGVKSPSEVPYLLFATGPSQTESFGLFSQGYFPRISSLFTPQALALASPLAGLTRDLLVADDVVAGGMPDGATYPTALLTVAGTAAVRGAFSFRGGKVDSIRVFTESPVVPLVRAYGASAGRLFSLVNPATLDALDVNAAIAGAPTTTEVNLTGVATNQPLAMVWHAGERALFVADELPGGGGAGQLRLLRIETDGRATELWRTRQGVFPTVGLTVSSLGELVLSLWGNGLGVASEIVLLGVDGRALRSKSINGILQDAALANAAGITVGSAPVGGGPLQVSLVARSTLVRGMCASNWLKSVADPGSILSDPTKNCP